MPAYRIRSAAWIAGVMLLPLTIVADTPAERRVPFWPDRVPVAIQTHVDGRAVLETVRDLGRFHRVQGSPGFAAAAEFVRSRAEAAGLEAASIERFPADGTTRYAHFRSYLGWTPSRAVLEEIEPARDVVARFPELPVALADYSQDADVTAELVDVGSGVDAAAYEGLDGRGRIVLASGALETVHQRAVIERGAAGFVSDFPNQPSAWSGDDRDLVRWGHLSPYERRNTFAFMVSRRQADTFRQRLAAGERIVLRAHVRAVLEPSTFDVVSAVIPGIDPDAGEIVLTAHLCHQSAGANDNASGSAAILEVGRALASAMANGALPRPRRTIRFLWVPEMAGSQAWLVSHPELARRLVAGVHMDMVGGRPEIIGGTLHLSTTAATLPHVVNTVARAFLHDVQRVSSRYAESGVDPAGGLVWAPGSRGVLVADVRGLDLGSDHQIFQDGAFRVPMVYFHDYPDVTIHTNKDQPENLDPTKLGRVAYMGAGIAWTLAALPDVEAARLLAAARADAGHAVVDAELRASLLSDPREAALVRRESRRAAAAALRSVAALWPVVAADAGAEAGRLEREASPVPAAPATDTRVPVKADDVRGPLEVYYFDLLAERLGRTAASITESPIGGDLDAVVQYEAFNLVDGRRTVGEIRDVLSGLYRPVPLGDLAAWFEELARARVVSLEAGQ